MSEVGYMAPGKNVVHPCFTPRHDHVRSKMQPHCQVLSKTFGVFSASIHKLTFIMV